MPPSTTSSDSNSSLSTSLTKNTLLPKLPPLSPSTLSSLSLEPLLVLLAAHGRTDMLLTLLKKLNIIPTHLIPHPSSSIQIETTPLHLSVQYERIDAIRALLSYNFPPNIEDSSHKTPIAYATNNTRHIFAEDACARAAQGDLDFLQLYLDAGLSPHETDSPITQNTPLHWAASFGNLNAVKLLVPYHNQLDLTNGKGATPLADAAVGGHLKVVEFLLKAGSSPNITIPPKHETLMECDFIISDIRDLIRTYNSNNVENKQQILNQHDQPSTSTTNAHFHDDSPLPSEPITPAFSSSSTMLPPQTPRYQPNSPSLVSRSKTIWPHPQLYTTSPTSTLTLPPVVTISADAGSLASARKLAKWVDDSPRCRKKQIRIRVAGGGVGGETSPLAFSAAIFLRIDPRQVPAQQGYRISVRRVGIYITAADPQGAFYACATLLAVLEHSADNDADSIDSPLIVDACSIVDSPSILKRALSLNISGDRVWKLDTMKRVVEFCAVRLKVNQLFLKMGRVFARISDSDTVHHGKQPKWTQEEVLELAQFCHDHFVQLIPTVDPKATFVINKQNGSSEEMQSEEEVLRDTDALFEEMLPLFNTDQVHTGRLGQENHVKQEDFAFIHQIAKLLRFRGSPTMFVYASSFSKLLEDEATAGGFITELPSNIVPILEVDDMDDVLFENRCSTFRREGLPIYTCLSSFLSRSFTGRLTDVIQKQELMIDVATREGAIGVMFHDDSGSSYGSPLISLLQLLIPFAGKAWNTNTSLLTQTEYGPQTNDLFAEICDQFLYHDSTEKAILGKITIDLGDLHRLAGDVSGSAIFEQLAGDSRERDISPIDKLTYQDLRQVAKRAERIEYALATYDGNADTYDVLEMRMSAMFSGVAARMCAALLWLQSTASMKSGEKYSINDISLMSLPDGRRSDFCNTYLEGIDLLRTTWMHRYEPYGFTKTVEIILGSTLAELAEGMPYQQYLEDRKADGWLRFD